LKKSFNVLAIVAVAVIIMSSSVLASGVVSTKKMPAQAIVTAKHTYEFGTVTLTPKCIGFYMADFSQYWIHVQADAVAMVKPFAGFVINWHGKESAFYYGARTEFSYDANQRFRTTAEAYKVEYDGDFFIWGCVEYNLRDKNSTYLGLHTEISNQDVTCLQAGPHLGFGDFELGAYFGKKASNVRAAFTVHF